MGLGDTDEGARIPSRNQDGSLAFVKHEGQEVWSKMDERLLKEIALTTSGAYVPARTRAYDLGSIYDEHLAKLTRGEIQAEKRKRYREQFQLFGGIGVALLLIEMLIPRFRVASGNVRRGPHESAGQLHPVTLRRDAGRRCPFARIRSGVDCREEGARRHRRFAQGDFEAAGKAFTEADVAEPENSAIYFDRACALAAAGDIEKARELFQQAALARDADLAARSHYNLGMSVRRRGTGNAR